MTDTQKKTIDAKAILADIRSGADESQIKMKFGLSDKGYRSVMTKLAEKGLLERPATEKPFSESVQDTAKRLPLTKRTWTCPACGISQDREYDECPKCGIVARKVSATRLPPPYRTPRHSSYESREESHEKIPKSGLAFLIIGAVVIVIIGVLMFRSGSDKKTTTTASSGPVQNFTTANFETEVKEMSKTMPVLVMFYADW